MHYEEPSSKPVVTNQDGVHPDLEKDVRRHMAHTWRKPIGQPTIRSYREVQEQIENAKEVILDSGCGTGLSTEYLARANPQALVIGVDKSIDRLSRSPVQSPNALLVRADLEDFWRILLERRVFPTKHYVLYPNPWPKLAHLGRRFHGHPLFKEMVALCPWIELRSNWKIYLDEFAQAWEIVTEQEASAPRLFQIQPNEAMTLFEKKYALSGHALWVWNSIPEQW
jgi:tRNA (guanine-N7-)-methyltransferase